jgi:predicted AlkP superfamily phosphohydrolase/phosphomutase
MNLRTLIIGIDGGTWRVLTPAIERGHMPFLKSLMDGGSSGTLLSTIPALTPPAWASFQTGRNPGATGVFCFTSFDRTSRRPGFVSAQLVRDTIWEQASRAGRKVVVINVPLTWPPRPVNGVMVTGLLTPSMKSDFTWPPQLKQELLKAVPGYHLFKVESDTGQPAYKDVEGFVGRMVDAARNRARGAEYLIEREKPDLCMVHFQTSDLIQHALWCYLDPCDPRYDAARHDYILKEFYRPLDQAVKDTHEAFVHVAGGPASVYVVSDHGFESHSKRFNLGTWLYQQGLLQRDSKVERPPLRKRITRALHVGELLRVFMSNESVQRFESAMKVAPQAVNWQTSQTYVAGYGSEAGIYFLQDDAALRENMAVRIIDGLKCLKDPATGQQFIDAIHRKEDIYHGSQMDMMPDLVVVPAKGYTCTGYCHPDRPLLEDVHPDRDHHIGKHHPEGILIACGEGIAARRGIRASLMDIAPTVLCAMGVPVSADMDGKLIPDLFTADFAAAHEVLRAGAMQPLQAGQAATPYSNDDEKEIRKRLRDLGYM